MNEEHRFSQVAFEYQCDVHSETLHRSIFLPEISTFATRNIKNEDHIKGASQTDLMKMSGAQRMISRQRDVTQIGVVKRIVKRSSRDLQT